MTDTHDPGLVELMVLLLRGARHSARPWVVDALEIIDTIDTYRAAHPDPVVMDADDALDEFGAGVPLEGMPPRFTIEHGVIHDRHTSQHVRTCDCVKGDGGILDAVRLLNELDRASHPDPVAAAKDAVIEAARKIEPAALAGAGRYAGIVLANALAALAAAEKGIE